MFRQPMESITKYEIKRSRYGYTLESVVHTLYDDMSTQVFRNYVAHHPDDLHFLKRLALKLTPDAEVKIPRDYWP